MIRERVGFHVSKINSSHAVQSNILWHWCFLLGNRKKKKTLVVPCFKRQQTEEKKKENKTIIEIPIASG